MRYENMRSDGGHLEKASGIRDLTYHPHFHRCMELDFCTEGEVRMTIAGGTWVLRKGQCAVLPSGVIHSYVTETHSELSAIFIGRDHIRDVVSAFEYSLPSRYIFDADGVLEEMVRSYFDGEGSVYSAKALVYHAMSLLMTDNPLTLRTECVNDIAVRLLEYIQEHFRDDISLCSLSDHLGYSHDYVSRLFRREMNTTFTRLLAETRVECAKEMLRRGDCSVTMAALSCGFGSIRSFNRVFLSAEGVSPLEYIRSVRP